jgi:3-deoxy-D-manno-octulosonic-acid transferase
MIWLYRSLWVLLGPFIDIMFCIRLYKGKEKWAKLPERMGFPKTERPEGDILWIHGASVGEMKSLFPLIDKLCKKLPNSTILLTSGTVTSASVVAKQLPNWDGQVIHQMAPLDFGVCVHAFLKHWKPKMSVIVESEFWPEYLKQAPNPMLINARVTKKSYKNFKRFSFFFKPLLARLTGALAQTDDISERLTDLGVQNVKTAPNIKVDAPLEEPNAKQRAKFTKTINGRPVLCFASTHPPEDEMTAMIHRALREDIPDLLSIVIPRHPERGQQLSETFEPLGLTTRRRSQGEQIDKQTDIYLADSMGEMPLWYSLSNAVIIGGSVFPHGGQNPLEPLKMGKVVLCGEYMFNFDSLLIPLERYKTPECYADITQLKKRAYEVLTDKKLRTTLEQKNIKAAASLSGGTDTALLAIVEAWEVAS